MAEPTIKIDLSISEVISLVALAASIPAKELRFSGPGANAVLATIYKIKAAAVTESTSEVPWQVTVHD